jgi:hypothetical protein
VTICLENPLKLTRKGRCITLFICSVIRNEVIKAKAEMFSLNQRTEQDKEKCTEHLQRMDGHTKYVINEVWECNRGRDGESHK